MKLDKSIVQRRLDLMADEGVVRRKPVVVLLWLIVYADLYTECQHWCRCRRPGSP